MSVMLDSLGHSAPEPFDFALREAQGRLRVNSAKAKNPYDEANEGIILGTLRRKAPQSEVTW